MPESNVPGKNQSLSLVENMRIHAVSFYWHRFHRNVTPHTSHRKRATKESKLVDK
jgi:hypothetical protein